MKNLMEQVYGLTNLALLTPQNLVENIQLENYLEIKYYKNEKEIICEMVTEEEDEEIRYIYSFTKNGQLQTIFAAYEGEEMELFDRSKELQLLLNEYDSCAQIHIA